jgi:putative SOS response-associated peptidase YedK
VDLFFRAIWPHRAIIAIDNWFEWGDERGPKKQPYLIRHRDRTVILCAAIGQYPNADHEAGEHDGFVTTTADSAGGMEDNWRSRQFFRRLPHHCFLHINVRSNTV